MTRPDKCLMDVLAVSCKTDSLHRCMLRFATWLCPTLAHELRRVRWIRQGVWGRPSELVAVVMNNRGDWATLDTHTHHVDFHTTRKEALADARRRRAS